MDPSLESERENKPLEEAELQRRELTLEDEQQIWKDITLTQYINEHARTLQGNGRVGAEGKNFNPAIRCVLFQLEEDSGCFIPR